jgi:hypothetical protein
MLWLALFVILAQNRKQNRRKRHLTLFQPFAFLNVYLPARLTRSGGHSPAVDIGKFDVHTLRHPCPG